MQYVYHCLEGQIVSIFVVPDRVLLFTPYAGRAVFDPDQYAGFIQQEFIRLVESGAIPKQLVFNQSDFAPNCPECGEISVELHAEGCRHAR